MENKDLEKVGFGIAWMFLVSWIWVYVIKGYLGLPSIVNTLIGIFALYGVGLAIFKSITKSIEDSPEIRKNKPSLRMMLFSFLLQFSAVLITTILMVVFFKITNKELDSNIDVLAPNMLFQLLIFNPIVEEYVFRKLFADKLLKHGELFFMLVSSFCFAIVHGVSLGIPQIVYTFVLGLIWSYLYVRTGNIWISVLMHSLSNLFGSVIMQSLQVASQPLMAAYSIGMMLLGIIGVILFIVNKKRISIGGEKRIINVVKTMLTNKGILFYSMLSLLMIALRTAQII